MEFSEPSQRPTYVGIANTVCGIALALAPLFGGWIAAIGYGWLFGASAVIGLVAVLLLQVMVAEPRHVQRVVVSVAESG
jgi:MFS family permease